MLDERFRLLPVFLVAGRFRPPDLRAELPFLLADFLPEPRFRLLPDFFVAERFLLLPDFFAAVPFLPADFRDVFLRAAVFFPEDVFLLLPDFFADARFLLLPPDFFLPPLSCLLTVRQARSSASFFDTPFFS